MALYVDNTTSETLNVSFLIWDGGCAASGQPWRKVAWYVIAPGRVIVPDILDVDLTTVNRYAYLYAYTASQDKDWQGTGNSWGEVSSGVHFDQCLLDETNCVKWVDFETLDFAGHTTDIVYVGPNAEEIVLATPTIEVISGQAQFYVSGTGFSAAGSVTVAFNYVDDNGDLTTGTFTACTSRYGSFSDIIDVPTLLYSGELAVEVTDVNYPGLTATIQINV